MANGVQPFYVKINCRYLTHLIIIACAVVTGCFWSMEKCYWTKAENVSPLLQAEAPYNLWHTDKRDGEACCPLMGHASVDFMFLQWWPSASETTWLGWGYHQVLQASSLLFSLDFSILLSIPHCCGPCTLTTRCRCLFSLLMKSFCESEKVNSPGFIS